MIRLGKHSRSNSFIGCLLFITIFFSLSSCIPTKKIAYLANVEEGAQFTTQDWKYIVAPGDRFYIKVIDPLANSNIGGLGNNTTSSQNSVNLITQSPSVHDYVVKEDGKIDYPMIGEIEAEGKTIEEFLNDHNISSPRSWNIFIN
jgi:polysaccharide export outer membrane protein